MSRHMSGKRRNDFSSFVALEKIAKRVTVEMYASDCCVDEVEMELIDMTIDDGANLLDRLSGTTETANGSYFCGLDHRI